MPPNDPIDEADEGSFPASDAPTFSGSHVGPPLDSSLLRVLINLPPKSTDEGYLRTALRQNGSKDAVPGQLTSNHPVLDPPS